MTDLTKCLPVRGHLSNQLSFATHWRSQRVTFLHCCAIRRVLLATRDTFRHLFIKANSKRCDLVPSVIIDVLPAVLIIIIFYTSNIHNVASQLQTLTTLQACRTGADILPTPPSPIKGPGKIRRGK